MHALARFRLAAAAFVALMALVAIAAGPAMAAPTDRNPDDNFLVIPVHETDDVPADICGFPLLLHVDGFIKIRFPSNSQQGVLEVDSFHLKQLWENPANGKTSDAPSNQTVRVIDNGDGTDSVVITGLSGRDTIPGAGRVTGDIGRLVITVDAATGDFISQDFIAGPDSNGPFPALCQYLA